MSPPIQALSRTVLLGLEPHKCRSVRHFSKLPQETQDSGKATPRPASELFCSYSGRALCIGSCLENPVERRPCGRYALLTGVSRVFLDFDAFQTGLEKVAILLVRALLGTSSCIQASSFGQTLAIALKKRILYAYQGAAERRLPKPFHPPVA